VSCEPFQVFFTNLQWAFGGALTLFVAIWLIVKFEPDADEDDEP
jgi:hypothetical protein